MRRISRGTMLVGALLLAACAGTPDLGEVPEGHLLEEAVAAVSSEIAVHRNRIAASRTMDELLGELARHETASSPLYLELGRRVGDMDGCADVAARGALAALMRGIEATERGRAEALAGATSVGDARRLATVYADGVAANIGQIVAVCVEQDGCYP
jgi:hypothetical protein